MDLVRLSASCPSRARQRTREVVIRRDVLRRRLTSRSLASSFRRWADTGHSLKMLRYRFRWGHQACGWSTL
jgi:hypothetical protein